MNKKALELALQKIVIWLILLIVLIWIIVWYGLLGGKTGNIIKGFFG